MGQGSHGNQAMSEQTATTSMSAAPRALELRPPREVARRARSERRRLAARLSIDFGSILCAALIVQASETVPLHKGTFVVAAAAILVGFAAAGLYGQST